MDDKDFLEKEFPNFGSGNVVPVPEEEYYKMKEQKKLLSKIKLILRTPAPQVKAEYLNELLEDY